jgi:glycosyltransferase involved in cell wall biosynthesis
MTPSLSALLIAKDEEQDLPACLAALKGVAGEIILVVSEDTVDATADIAAAAGARVLRRRFDDYARQRQAGLDAATGDWCLWIDPDEIVSAPLADEIRTTLAHDEGVGGYELPFEVEFLGKVLRWGGLGSESHLRLFRRKGSRFVGGELHESVSVEGEVRRLSGAVRHRPYRDVTDYLSKLDRYTTLAARKRDAAGRRFNPLHYLLLPWEFFARAVLKLGFLDGFPGLVWAGLSAIHAWLKYVKLGELQRRARAAQNGQNLADCDS